MSRLYVGQRVRIVCVDSVLYGRETTIASELYFADGGSDGRYWGHDVSIPMEAGDAPTFPGQPYCFEPHELTPILYDGNQLVSWSECAWQPEGVSA